MSGFFAAFLSAVADFLGSEPVIYLFGLVCLVFLVKVFRQLLP